MEKIKAPVIVVLVILFLVVCVVRSKVTDFLQQRQAGQSETQQHLRDFSSLSATRYANIEKQFDSLSTELSLGKQAVNGAKAALEGRCSQIDEAIRQGTEAISNSNTQMRETIKLEIDRVSQDNKECIARILNAEYEIKSNSTYANEAIELAESAIQNKEYDLAKVYVLNAINHMPYEIKYIEIYYNLVCNECPVTLQELRQLINILDVSVYQINPSAIASVVAMKQNIMQTMAMRERKEQEISVASLKEEMNRHMNELEQGELSWQHIRKANEEIDSALLKQRIELLEGLINSDVLQV